MYKIEISGCLTSLFILMLVILVIKELWWFIVGLAVIIIVLYYAKLIYKNITAGNNSGNEQYNPQMGEVYKICPYCNAKVKVTAVTCPVCKHALN